MSERIVNAYLDEDELSLVLLHRDTKGALVRRTVRPEWVSYHLRAELRPHEDLMRMLSTSQAVRSVTDEGEYVRVAWVDKWARRGACFGKRDLISPFQREGVRHFEADVDPVRRYLTDHDVELASPRRCYLDLECDSRVPFSRKEEMRILSWAVTDDDGFERVEALSEETDAAERDLIGELLKVLGDYDQVLAWSGDRFDFPVLTARTNRHIRGVDMKRWHWLDHLVLFRRMNMHSAESGEEKASFALGAISQALLGDTKDDFDASKTYEAWKNATPCPDGKCRACRACLMRYNLKDTVLLTKIERKTGYVALFGTLSEVCRVMPNSQGLQPTRQMDGYMLRLGKEAGKKFPSKTYRDSSYMEEQFDGAYVMEPKNMGIRRNVHVCDFSSLYPSIILTWNMSPETKYGTPYLSRARRDRTAESPPPFPVCTSPITGQRFRTDVRGILPYALEQMIAMRKKWNDLKASLPPGTPEWHDADRRSTAYKVAANSFYGVVGSPFSRFYDRDVAESVTQNGKWLLVDLVLAEAERRGMTAEYGDTDSGFVAGTDRASFAAFVRECNEVIIPAALRDVAHTARNDIKLAYEKEFRILVFVSAKRYVGYYAHYKGKEATSDSKPEVKGLEYKRGDSSAMARRLQQRVIEMLRDNENAPDYRAVLREAMEEVTSGPLTYDQVVVSKNLSKPLSDYGGKTKKDGTESVPAHVIVGRILEARGLDVGEGTRVEYVVVDGSKTPAVVIPGQDYAGECDRWYLWENLVYPPTQRLLEAAFVEHDWKTGLEKIRPATPRAKGAPLPGQLALDVERAAPGRVPFVLHVGEDLKGAVEDVKAVLKRHPGMRPVEMHVHLRSGAVAVLDVPIHVSGTAHLEGEVRTLLWDLTWQRWAFEERPAAL